MGRGVRRITASANINSGRRASAPTVPNYQNKVDNLLFESFKATPLGKSWSKEMRSHAPDITDTRKLGKTSGV